MTTTDSARIERVRAAIQSGKDAHDRMQKDIAAHLLDDGWMTAEHLERVVNCQARVWVWDSLESVLLHCEEDDAYTIPGTVAALRRRLVYLLQSQSLAASTSPAYNLLENAKISALQTIITTGPLAY